MKFSTQKLYIKKDYESWCPQNILLEFDVALKSYKQLSFSEVTILCAKPGCDLGVIEKTFNSCPEVHVIIQ